MSRPFVCEIVVNCQEPVVAVVGLPNKEGGIYACQRHFDEIQRLKADPEPASEADVAGGEPGGPEE